MHPQKMCSMNLDFDVNSIVGFFNSVIVDNVTDVSEL